MISQIDFWKMTHPSAPLAASYGPRASVDRWAASDPQRRDGFVIERVRHCICCGSQAIVLKRGGSWRCERHRDSMPCLIEGCLRSSSRVRGAWVCGPHWKAGVPPGSPARKVWLRFWRIVRRFGWNAEREARMQRLWRWLLARCRAAAAGDLDQREIDRLFGWG